MLEFLEVIFMGICVNYIDRDKIPVRDGKYVTRKLENFNNYCIGENMANDTK